MKFRTSLSILLIVVVIVSLPSILTAQAPQKLNYQSIVRDNGGTPITNQNVSFRMSVLEDNISGTIVFSETQQTTTNDFGSVSFLIGSGQVIQGTLGEIDWGSQEYFLKTEIDVNGGSNYTEMGTSQLVSVPYALHANEAATSRDGKTYLIFYGDITDNEAVQKIEQESGPNTQVIRANKTTLSNLTLNGIQELETLKIMENQLLTSLSVPDLQFIMGDDDNFRIQSNPVLSSVDLSALEYVQGRLRFSDNDILSNISLNSLNTVGVLEIYEPAVTSIDLPSLVACRNLFITSNPNLTTLTIPSIDFSQCVGTIRLKNNAFSSSTINDLLSRLVSANVTGLNIQLENQTPPAPPTGQGILDKQTLIDNGNTVTTD